MMTVTKASKSRRDQESKGYVMFGNVPDSQKWFERWYPTKEKAIAFADRMGWEYKQTASKYDRLELSLNR